MNIFSPSRNPTKCARALDDKRLVKMVLETAQMLCTVINLDAGAQVTQYKNSHATNKLVLWAQADPRHFAWLYELGVALGAEYSHRYGRKHASSLVIEGLAFNHGHRLNVRGTPKEWVNAASHKKLGLDFTHLPHRQGYRAYLNRRWATDKRSPVWTKRKPPKWAELH